MVQDVVRYYKLSNIFYFIDKTVLVIFQNISLVIEGLNMATQPIPLSCLKTVSFQLFVRLKQSELNPKIGKTRATAFQALGLIRTSVILPASCGICSVNY